MPVYRMGEVAALLGVSPDTARRWADGGALKTRRTSGGQRVVDGKDLAAFLRAEAHIDEAEGPPSSARNRFTGIVTAVVRDKAAASVEIHTGTARIVSLMTREAADDLGLEPGMLATASVKATNVTIGLPRGRAEP
ncbi:MAG TPA: helix-turn-helix transcriptional regulator [Actinomycetota bacterium]|nr:helix-turn-helix transcriptional regulator [Actinomycetota bacterium]